MCLMKLAKIHHREKLEPMWHVQLALLAAIGIQAALSARFTIGPKYIIAVFEIIALLALSIPGRKAVPSNRSAMVRRFLAFGLLGVVTVTNIGSLILVSHALITGNHTSGHALIISALVIYATNIIVFGLLYWELDGKASEGQPMDHPDFLFPQMMVSDHITKQSNWHPSFFDYLYVSISNATAFSSTDTLPLTYRAKALMAIQALTAITTIALVAARAVNILV